MGMTFVLSLFSLAAILSGCTSFESGVRRELVLESSWVRSTAKKENLSFRRMNRMTPVFYENGPLQLVIQGNALDGIVAYNRGTGSEVWRLDLENGVEGGAALAGDRLYFGSSDGSFYAVSARNGRVLWSTNFRAETLAPPSVENGVVYAQSGADVLYALDAETGRQIWRYNRQVTDSLSIRATTQPVVVGDLVLAGFSDGFLVALKKRDGNLVWERKLGRSQRFHDVDSTPVVDGKNVYVASFDAALYSLNVATGEINWTVNEGAYVPVTLGEGRFSDRLYYATANGKILILDKVSGKQIGEIQVRKGIATQPVLYRNYLIYGESEGALTVADAESGRALARFYPGEGVVARPAIWGATGDAFFISKGANLHALRLSYKRATDNFPWRKGF